jgi:hypothetical protein
VSASPTDGYTLQDLALCFEGVVPAVIATASADGTPNITYLSRVLAVDHDHVALSNQFFSKTARNLAENPRASVLLIAPTTYDQFRLTLVYERTEKRGATFERLRDDVDAIAEIEGMQDVFKLRTADIYRVLDIELVMSDVHRRDGDEPAVGAEPTAVAATDLAELIGRLGRCADLNTLLNATVDGLASVLGYEHSLVLLLDETGQHLYTIASHGYDAEGVGSEVTLGEGVSGMAAARCAPMRVGNLRQMTKYSRIVRQAFEDPDRVGPGHELPVPVLPEVQSRLAVPAMAGGQLIGVLMVESDRPVAFGADDEAALVVVASVVANAIEADRAWATAEDEGASRARSRPPAPPLAAATHVRFFAVDGSTFLGGEYLIKGVAGRILWSLLGQYEHTGQSEFTNREIRLDPTLELPQFRDNLESRLILLKRRLDERGAPIRLEKSGRGRFALVVDTELRLDEVAAPDA